MEHPGVGRPLLAQKSAIGRGLAPRFHRFPVSCRGWFRFFSFSHGFVCSHYTSFAFGHSLLVVAAFNHVLEVCQKYRKKVRVYVVAKTAGPAPLYTPI